jgi:hypothetical protein
VGVCSKLRPPELLGEPSSLSLMIQMPPTAKIESKSVFGHCNAEGSSGA